MLKQLLLSALATAKSSLVEIANRVAAIFEEVERFFTKRLRTTGSHEPIEYERALDMLRSAQEQLSELSHELRAFSRKVAAGSSIGSKLETLARAVSDLQLLTWFAQDSVRKGYEFEPPWVVKQEEKKAVVTEDLYSVYEQLRNELKKLGRDCGYTLRTKKPGDDIDLALLMNDISNCIHVVAEELVKAGKEFTKYRSVGRCWVAPNSDPWLVELCERWSRYVDENRARGLYKELDFEALTGVVEGGHASIRVGSAVGHATHIEVKNGEVEVQYYDRDEKVNEVIYRLLSRICRCRKHAEGVACTCPKNGRTLDALARTMSLATSMDFRISEHGMERELEFAERFVWGEAA